MRKIYKVKLTTIGPVHIGSGIKLNKSQYVFDRNNRRIYIPDERKVMNWIIEKNLINQLESYFIRGKRDIDLYDWFRQNHLLNEFQENMLYSYSTSSLKLGKDTKLNDIDLTIKDKEFNPYIPGSSLKGAIRTALLGDYLGSNNIDTRFIDDYLRNKNRGASNNLKKEIGFIEKRVFEKRIDQKNTESRMKYLLISDSEPISNENIILAQKIDYGVKYDNGKGIPLFRESIKPGTEINFEMVIRDEFNQNIEDIKESIDNFYSDLDSSFLSHFNVESRNSGYIYLGGGSGFPSKTVLYSLLGYEKGLKVVSKILQEKFYKHKHFQDINLGVSPRTLKKTLVDNKDLEMGLCKIEFEEIL